MDIWARDRGLLPNRGRWKVFDSGEEVCFVTGNAIDKNDLARYTDKFDAWVSTAGQNIINTIYNEWCTQDAVGKVEDEQFRKGYI